MAEVLRLFSDFKQSSLPKFCPHRISLQQLRLVKNPDEVGQAMANGQPSVLLLLCTADRGLPLQCSPFPAPNTLVSTASVLAGTIVTVSRPGMLRAANDGEITRNPPGTGLYPRSMFFEPRLAEFADVDTAMNVTEVSRGAPCHFNFDLRTSYGYDARIEIIGSGGRVDSGAPLPLDVATYN